MAEPMVAGWHRDPFGRHAKRYHTGSDWTEHVRDRGRPGIDPPHGRITETVPPSHEPIRSAEPIEAAPRAPDATAGPKADPAAAAALRRVAESRFEIPNRAGRSRDDAARRARESD